MSSAGKHVFREAPSFLVSKSGRMGRSIFVRIILLTGLLLPIASGPSAAGAQWYVDGAVSVSGDGTSWETAFEKIQEGIDAATDGDTVIVAEGTYLENIRLRGENIVLQSTDPLNPDVVGNTVIDGNAAGSVVTFAGTEDENCVLSGFTIRNGLAREGGGICGGTRESRTVCTMENNLITGNWAELGGGLLYCDGTIRDNIFRRNRADGRAHDSGTGGAIAYCDGMITGNTVAENWAQNAGGGLSHCHGVIANNLITGNSAASSGGLSGCDGVIRNNVITLNCALDVTPGYGAGGGLGGCSGTVCNNLIASNSASVAGGGLALCFGIIRNNTIVWNSAWTGGGLYQCDAVTLNCIIWRNTHQDGSQLRDSSVPVHSCIEGWTGGGEGNISEDPRFADGEFRLMPESACVDAGLNEDWMWEAVDLDGNPRIFYGGKSRTVDMGAYEYGSWPFRIVVIRAAQGGAELTWTSRPGDSYIVWSCPGLGSGSWKQEGMIASQGALTAWSDGEGESTCKFYRIEIK